MHPALTTHDQIQLAAQVGGSLASVKREAKRVLYKHRKWLYVPALLAANHAMLTGLQAHRPDLFEGGSISAEKLARHRSYRKVLKYGSVLSPFTAPLTWWALRKWDDHDVRALDKDDRADPNA